MIFKTGGCGHPPLQNTHLYSVGDDGASSQWEPLRSRSTDRGGSGDPHRPLYATKNRLGFSKSVFVVLIE